MNKPKHYGENDMTKIPKMAIEKYQKTSYHNIILIQSAMVFTIAPHFYFYPIVVIICYVTYLKLVPSSYQKYEYKYPYWS